MAILGTALFPGHFNINKVQWKELKCSDTLFQFDVNIALSLLLLHDATIHFTLQDYCLNRNLHSECENSI